MERKADGKLLNDESTKLNYYPVHENISNRAQHNYPIDKKDPKHPKDEFPESPYATDDSEKYNDQVINKKINTSSTDTAHKDEVIKLSRHKRATGNNEYDDNNEEEEDDDEEEEDEGSAGVGDMIKNKPAEHETDYPLTPINADKTNKNSNAIKNINDSKPPGHESYYPRTPLDFNERGKRESDGKNDNDSYPPEHESDYPITPLDFNEKRKSESDAKNDNDPTKHESDYPITSISDHTDKSSGSEDKNGFKFINPSDRNTSRPNIDSNLPSIPIPASRYDYDDDEPAYSADEPPQTQNSNTNQHSSFFAGIQTINDALGIKFKHSKGKIEFKHSLIYTVT